MALNISEHRHVSASPQNGIMHGPHKPLTDMGIEEYRRWEGAEFDLTDLEVQRLHQLRQNLRQVWQITEEVSVVGVDVLYIRDINETAIKQILDASVDR